ncbi:TPA: hypothetical protein PTV74_003308 [Clostridium botulinum]|nr:hypothetical protein [Clostridium botulinum]HDK7206463.1 hypothetical protein [Clostridium botulinum]HDK7210198.1 hypothetical protein [Clostridium botulinum]HDK7265648.1 hypothetical protein [Clostridium botulinum]HDK7269495.1 hypothetical protein [Clostridium botulinum]
MEKTIKMGNETKYYLDDILSLTITELENNNYIVENRFGKLQGYCKNLDKYRTKYRLDKNYSKGKNGRLYNTKRLFNHNEKWFCYILQERGFVSKTLPIQN